MLPTIANYGPRFQYLVSVSGQILFGIGVGVGKEDAPVKVVSGNDTIQIHLPSGRLIFSTADVLQRLYASREKDPLNATLFVTENISLQLLNTEW